MMSEKMVWENLLCGEGENSRDSILFACSIQDVVVIEHLHYHQRKIRLCDLLTKILNGGILYCQIAAIPCSQQFCNFVEDSMMLSESNTTMSDFPVHHSPGNWRPINCVTDSYSSSVSSSSKNVSPKGAKFSTYSSKAYRNVSPTFGFGDNIDAKWSTRFLDRELHIKDLPPWCQNHGKGGVHAHDTIRPAIREKIPAQCQGIYAAAQKLGKTAYLCDSHAQDPSLVSIVCVVHFPSETCDPVRPFRLNSRGEFENPSLRSMADIFIGCMIAHGCDPGVAKNLAYGGLLGVVDVLPLMGPHDWHSKKAVYSAPNDYDTAMSQMAEASSEMLEALPSIFPNFQGYFLFGEAHDFFRKYMGKSKHPVLNTERVIHPTSIECKWWDTDHQKVAVRQACRALFVATGLDFCHSNIENFDDVMPVSAGMKRKSEERLDAAIRREEEEMAAAEEEALCVSAAAIRREEEEEFIRTFLQAEEEALERRRQEEEVAKAAAAIRRGKEEGFNRSTFLQAEEEALERRRQERKRKHALWTAELDETITRMRADGISFSKISSRLGNALSKTEIKNRWNHHLNA
jgi:hypothetical protein